MGWLDWPAGEATQMTVVSNYARAMQLYDAHAGRKGWVDANQGIMELVTQVWKWRKEAGYSAWM